MADVEVTVETGAAPEAIWPLVRDLATRSRYLPAEGFRDVKGDADAVTMQARVPKGWVDVAGHITGEEAQVWVTDRATGDGVELEGRFELKPGRVVARVSYQFDGVPGIVERTVLRPLVKKQFEAAVKRLVEDAERAA